MKSRIVFASIVTLAFLMVFTGCNSTKKAINSLQNGDFSSAAEAYSKSNDADEKKQIRKAAEDRLASAVTEYNDGQITYEDASDILEEIKDTGIVSSSKVETAKESLDGLEWSKRAYQIAEDYLNAKDYLSAMSFYSLVDPMDTLSAEAEGKLKKARSLYIEEAEQNAAAAAARQDYETAIQVLKACSQNLGTVDEIEVLIRKYETDDMNSAINNALAKATASMDSKDYPTAYLILLDASSSFPGRVEIETALTTCRRDYIAYALNQAETLFSSTKDYNGAISILSMAMIDLPDNPELQAAIDKYTAYRPVEIRELTVFYEEGWGFGSYRREDIRDNVGNTYHGYYEGEGAMLFQSDNGVSVYRINGAYTRITGVVFVPEHRKNEDNLGHVTIYADGKQIFDSGTMGKGVEPVSFDLNITGVVELKLEENWGETSNWSPYLANIWLSKDVDN